MAEPAATGPEPASTLTTLVVMAKECVPGRVKTRLSPPFSLAQAARIAQASLEDTLTFGSALEVTRRVLCFAGTHPPADAGDWEVVAQEHGGLDERIAAVLDGCTGPTLLIGMDTPQLRTEHIALALAWPDDADALLGMAEDGGFWALALREPAGSLVRGIPMSRPDTGARQRERLEAAGLRVRDLPMLTDLDTAASLAVVAADLPGDGQLARLLRSAA
jgi:glycosyltransferase A (GT-A) superfamily protein (DUF2064 family)